MTATDIPDLSPLSALDERAQKVKHLEDIRFPTLRYWNYGPCRYHDEPTPQCEYRLCGGDLWAHQRVGATWLYVRRRGLLADDTGTGKTNQVYALLAMMKERGELTSRALIVCKTSAALQWYREAQRWVPAMNVVAALSGMTRRRRIEVYTTNWDVLVIGSDLMMRDVDMLDQLAPTTLIVDDVDALLNHETQTHHDLHRLRRNTDRSIVINATAIQIRLQQLHAALSLTDGHEKFGPLSSFERRHVRSEPITVWNRKTGRKVTKTKTIGYRNMEELKDKVAPMILRRKAEDLHDVDMPTVMPPTDVWLDLHPEQQKRYEELRRGVLRLIAEEGERVKKVTALTKITYGQQICAGLPALILRDEDGERTGYEADGPGKSVKLDWLMERLTTEWQGEKVVCFIKNLGMVSALADRLGERHIGMAAIVGGQDAAQRNLEVDRFWNEPSCQVMVGTSAIERSLNLQVSQRLVFVDTHLNPARMHQILGRIKRGGSRFEHLFVYNLFAAGTQEEGYKAILEARQALADYVFDDTSELFDALEPLALLELIGKRPQATVDRVTE